MPWYTLALVVASSLLIGMGIWSCAYRFGLKRGRSAAVPFRLVDELLDHRITCLGQDPALARLEIGTLLGIEEWRAQRPREELTPDEHDLANAHVYH
jgi:hypothetical protein